VFSARIDAYWQDQVVFHVTRPQRDAGWNYAVVNGRLQFAEIPLAKGSLDLAVFGRNLFDRKYRTWAIDFGSGLGFDINNYGDPRTVGLGLTYHFTAS
jgi:iron complex outermembrane receptor protein